MAANIKDIVQLDGEWVWCLHCERASHAAEWSPPECPFEDCDGGPFDAWSYSELRERAHPEWPQTPVRGELYPQYG